MHTHAQTVSVHFDINYAWALISQYITSLIVKFTPIKPNCNGHSPSHQCLPCEIFDARVQEKIAWSIYSLSIVEIQTTSFLKH